MFNLDVTFYKMLSLLGRAHSEESHRSEFEFLMFKVNNLFNEFLL